MKSLFNYVPVNRPVYQSRSKEHGIALLESKLHSNKIAVLFSKIPISYPDKECHNMVVTGVDVASGNVLWLFPIPEFITSQVQSKLLLVRQAAAAHPAEVILLLWGSGRHLSYRLNTATGSLIDFSEESEMSGKQLVDVAALPDGSDRSSDLHYVKVS